jgi:Flp pilus assembly protein CpaB
MQNRMPILIALVAGLLAVVLTNLYVTQVREEAAPDQTLVMVAANDLQPGTILEAKDVTQGARFTQALPKLHIPWGERNLYLGQELRQQVSAGDYILVSYFGAEAGAARLAEKVDVKLNQRAFTMPVTAESSLEGSIRPGDRIDIVITYLKPAPPAGPGQAASAGPQYVTAALLENIYVLATGKYATGANERYNTITLMVSSDEAKLLAWAMKLGELSVLLRNPKDVAPTDRAFLSGDLRSLAGLGKIEMRVEDVVSKGK